MPSAFPATVAEREAELIALQSAFDEYIASSRELEEELDAELAKMQEKLAESSAANAALSAQLENIAPQLSALESALTDSRHKLKQEQKLRRAAEQAQDEADQRNRELEQSLQQVREECDAVHEELAFKENELEELRLELEVEKQQWVNELEHLKAELQRTQAGGAALSSAHSAVSATSSQAVAPVSEPNDRQQDDDQYAVKLEEELELVTEQLIEMEKRLSEVEMSNQEKDSIIANLQSKGRRDEDEDLIRQLQVDNADRLESEQRLRDELTILKEELTLSKEEVALQQEELQAAEADYKQATMELEELRVKHKEEITKLQIRIKEAEMASKNTLGEAALVASTVQEATTENLQMRDEIAHLESALQNAKRDYQQVLDELDAVHARFDEAREEARREGRESALEELKESRRPDITHELEQVKEQLLTLNAENKVLQEKVDAAELELAAARDSSLGDTKGSDAGDSEVVKQLHSQLARAKEDMEKKEEEISALQKALQEGLAKTEENQSHLENQLSATKGKLAEAEARLIVVQREKDRAENKIPLSPKKASKMVLSTTQLPKAPMLVGRERSRSVDRAELGAMDDAPVIQESKMRHRSRSSSPSSVMRLEIRLQEEHKKFDDLQKKYDDLSDQKRMGEVRIKRLEEDLRVLQKQLFSSDGAVVTQMSRLSSLANTDKGMDVMKEEDTKGGRIEEIIASKDIKAMSEELKSMEKKVNSQREYNAQLLSKMLHLQGNIQVYCRIRPMSLSEIERGYKSIAEPLSESEVGCFDNRTNKWKSFAFDRVWGPDQSQQSVFQDVEPLALSVVDGFNACIFAYGQTGSGKTFTMEGVEENNQFGISYRTIQKIFHLLNLRAQQQRAAEMFIGSDEDAPAKEVSFKFAIKIGMLEIYNDEIYDLLNTAGASMEEKKRGAMEAGGKGSLEIRRNEEGRIEVPNLVKESVSTIEEVMDLLKKGNANRATAATDMNLHSSRSHMVLIVDVISGLEDTQSNKGTLYLVDLAGSERVRKSNVEGEQLKEAGFINKSLSALGNVMEALDRKASHIPYRDSKLTYMLQDSLGGNSRTMMVVAICPHDNSYDETVHALQFATRVRRIQIGAAQRNVTSKNLEETVKTLTEEMRALTRAKERSESQLLSLKRDNARVQEKLTNLNKLKTQSKAESKTLDVLRKNNDDMAARWQKEKQAREELTEELESTRKELRSVQQQLGKQKTQMTGLEKALQDKEHELALSTKRLMDARNNKAAATVRARRDQVLSSRARPTPTPQAARPSPSAKVVANASPVVTDKPGSTADSVESDADVVADVRSRVLALLEQHDPVKADRVDIIMDKFKGKEMLLLEKMTQRYEGVSAKPITDSFLSRNQLSIQRHEERMKRIREKQAGA